MSDPVHPREQIALAFVALLQGVTADPVERNRPEPADLTSRRIHHLPSDITSREAVILIDGAEDEPKLEPLTGLFLHRVQFGIEGYAISDDPSAMNDLLRRVLLRVFGSADTPVDPTLGGLLYGKRTSGTDRPHFDGLEEGALGVEVYRSLTGPRGAAFIKELVAVYATTPEDRTTLVPSEAGEG